MQVFPDFYQSAVEFSQRPPIDEIANEQIAYYNEKVFGRFIELAFNMKLHEIRRALQYTARLLALTLQLDPPDCSNLGEDPEDVKIEEFLGLQTYNPSLLPYLEWLA